MTITLFRNKGPVVGDGYQIIQCDSSQMALDHVNRAFWPVKWKEDIAAGIPPMLGTDPVTTLNVEFNKNGYWFLDYWDEAWPLMRNEAVAGILREHFEGETCEAPKSSIRHSSLGGLSQLESEKRNDPPRPSRIAITTIQDEGEVKYFDSMHQLGDWVRQLAFGQGGAPARNALEKLPKLEDRLAIYGWVLNGETGPNHWVGRAFHYLLDNANLDDFERRILEGLHARAYEGDTEAAILRDLFINGPLSND